MNSRRFMPIPVSEQVPPTQAGTMEQAGTTIRNAAEGRTCRADREPLGRTRLSGPVAVWLVRWIVARGGHSDLFDNFVGAGEQRWRQD